MKSERENGMKERSQAPSVCVISRLTAHGMPIYHDGGDNGNARPFPLYSHMWKYSVN